MSYESKLKALGINLGPPRTPAGSYVPAKVIGHLAYCSGQGSDRPDGTSIRGQLGKDLDVPEGYEAARLCAINCLSALKYALSDLDTIAGVLQVRGFVASTADFQQHPAVLNGASDLFIEVFGEAGRHVRTTVGVAALPKSFAVEVDLVVHLRADRALAEGAGS